MSSGPPPDEAGPSNHAFASSSQNSPTPTGDATIHPVQHQTYTGSFQAHTNATPYYPNPPPPGYAPHWNTNTQNVTQNYYGFHNYSHAWNGSWPPGYGYPSHSVPQHAPQPLSSAVIHVSETPVRVDTPPPLPYHKHWDEVIATFLKSAGLTQALRGFQADITIMNEEHQQNVVPLAMKKLKEDIEVRYFEANCITSNSIFLETGKS